MWFPLMLLRATAERTRDGRRVGALVELVGVRRVGKTVLALQAMDRQGFIPADCDDRHVDLRDFIYSRKVGDEHRLFETLRLRFRMERNKKDIFLPRGTPNVIGDLKTVFLRPAVTPATIEEARPKSVWKQTGELVLSRAVEMADIIMGDEDETPHQPSTFWWTVAFYDTAGEASENDDPVLTPIERAVDKAAILIDAREIFDGHADDEESSISVAAQRIRRLHDFRHLSGAIVVTKLDLVFDQLTEEEREKVFAIAENLNEWPQDYSAARELLSTWLQQNPSDSNGELRASLRSDIGPVFFVWTKNLPTSHDAGQQSTQPYSYGLARFICWCLDTEWAALNLHR